MTHPLDHAEIERRAAALHARDADIGRRVEARVAQRYGAASSLEEYRFDDSFARDAQASQKIDWVHQDHLRVVRFVYRHLPRPLRFLIKKVVP
jgi:hypothetical protein